MERAPALREPAVRGELCGGAMVYGQGDEPDVECWGGVLKGDGGAGCDSSFVRGRRHMCARPPLLVHPAPPRRVSRISTEALEHHARVLGAPRRALAAR